MSFFSIDFDYCRAQGKTISALNEDCIRLSALLRADGKADLADEAEALGAEMTFLGEAVYAAVAQKEAADTQILRELGQRDEKAGER